MDVDKAKKIMETITALMDKKFTGYIQVNFTRGSIGRIVKFEEILKKIEENEKNDKK